VGKVYAREKGVYGTCQSNVIFIGFHVETSIGGVPYLINYMLKCKCKIEERHKEEEREEAVTEDDKVGPGWLEG
jgi:hypothetical protein